MENKNVLAIDDELHILELLKYNLESAGFKAFCALNAEEGFNILENYQIDVILLDVMLPDIDGISILKSLKETKFKEIPVIMVTAKTDEIDRIIGLELGADDYISKPFSVRELIARVKVVSRRSKKGENNHDYIVYKNMQMDLSSHELKIDGKLVELSYKEFGLLKILLENKGRVLTREILLDKIWGYDYQGETRTVDVHVRYLRGKFEKFGYAHWIETVRGVGYKFIKE
ncbi:MAG: DNA-binding response regulator [Epulopiscium sp. Nuni2H_MBin003]|nr:MAG: DNA-binding response regulator [Epulopiscium sp. Nuni2H_MBin003]